MFRFGRKAQLAAQEPIAQAINAVIAAALQALRSRDLAAYLALVPAELLIERADGTLINRNQHLAELAAEWQRLTRVLELHVEIERLAISQASAGLISWQRYRRLILGQDQRSEQDLLSIRRQYETWHALPEGWRCVYIKELDHELAIDGRPAAMG